MTKRDRQPLRKDEPGMPSTVQPGRYRHYKGKEYRVVGCARHSETEEEFVIYRALYGDRELWARPKTMFTEMIQINGKAVPRFELIESA